MTYYQAEQSDDQARSREFDQGSCLASAEAREQQRERDQNRVDDLQADLDALDVQIANAVSPDEVPAPDWLLPVLVFLADDRDEGYDVRRDALVARLDAAKAERDDYIARFPIPACDTEGLRIDPSPTSLG
jgi:hypothetical protein